MPRSDEVSRILDLADSASQHRLLLTGPAAGGKSVLLAQIATTLMARGEHVIYLSMDQPPTPKPEPDARRAIDNIGLAGAAALPTAMMDDSAPAKTLAVPVRMNLLSALLRLSGYGKQLPTEDWSEQRVREQVQGLLPVLAERGDGPVWVLIDALDQASDEPAALLSGLPRPTPAMLRIIATTQPITSVINAVEERGKSPWGRADLSTIGHDLTRALLLYDWPKADRDALLATRDGASPAINDALLDELQRHSAGLPLLLRAWGRDLLQRWQNGARGPAAFAAFRDVLAKADHSSMPPDYRKRLDRARELSRPTGLADLLLWTLALLERPLDLDQLLRAATALAPRFPSVGAVTRDTLRTVLGQLGGFVAVTGTELDPRWRLYHKLIGGWFISEHGQPALTSTLREALVPLGARPDLDDPASLAAWATRVLDGEPEFTGLPDKLRSALLERLLDGLPDGRAPLDELARFGHRRAGLGARLALERQQDGQRGAAAKQADQARALAERLLGDADPEQRADLLQDLGFAWGAVGLVKWYAGAMEQARDATEQSLKIRQGLRDDYLEAWTPGRQQGLATTHNNLGIVLHGLKHYDEALEAYDHAIELYQGLDLNKPEVRQALGNSHNNRGSSLDSIKRYDEALEAYDRAIELYQGLDLDQPEVRQALGDTHNDRGITLNNLERYDEALEAYDRAIELYQGLDLDQPEVRRALGNSHNNRGGTLDDLKRYDQALEAYDRAIELYQGLDLDQPEVRRSLGNSHYNRGSTLDSIKRYDEALEAYDRAIKLSQGLDLDQPEVRQDLGNSWNGHGLANYALGCLRAAFDDLDRAIKFGVTNAKRTRQSPWLLWSRGDVPSGPEDYNSVLPNNDSIDWQPPPLIGGDWSALTGEAVRPMLASLTTLLRLANNPTLLQRIEQDLTALRSRPLACYPGWLLCEARIGNDDGAGALPFLYSGDGIVLLSGASAPIHAFNRAIDLRLGDQRSYLDYWLLFCSAVRGNEARFQVIESVDTLVWRTDTDPDQIATLVAKLEEPQIQALDDDGASITGDVLYDGSINRAKFKVHGQGNVEMVEDQGIAEAASVRTEHFDGPIREWADDPATKPADEDSPFEQLQHSTGLSKRNPLFWLFILSIFALAVIVAPVLWLIRLLGKLR